MSCLIYYHWWFVREQYTVLVHGTCFVKGWTNARLDAGILHSKILQVAFSGLENGHFVIALQRGTRQALFGRSPLHIFRMRI